MSERNEGWFGLVIASPLDTDRISSINSINQSINQPINQPIKDIHCDYPSTGFLSFQQTAPVIPIIGYYLIVIP